MDDAVNEASWRQNWNAESPTITTDGPTNVLIAVQYWNATLAMNVTEASSTILDTPLQHDTQGFPEVVSKGQFPPVGEAEGIVEGAFVNGIDAPAGQ